MFDKKMLYRTMFNDNIPVEKKKVLTQIKGIVECLKRVFISRHGMGLYLLAT
jgi:hypothetical protein